MKIISVRENPNVKDKAIEYISSKWSAPRIIYDDGITNCITTHNPLPQWYILEENGEIIGCAGLVTNDFISRMDLYPWFSALFIEENYRGNSYGLLLIEKAKHDAKVAGFQYLYLSTEHIGYYEKYEFKYIGNGYHPWGKESRIYEIEL
jgi:N-acetylglutamate synthase-like GNAT family acetyltransferase